MVIDITDNIPHPDEFSNGNEGLKKAHSSSLEYMDLTPGDPITDINVDRVFIGSVHQFQTRGPPRSSRCNQWKDCSPERKSYGCARFPNGKSAVYKLGLIRSLKMLDLSGENLVVVCA